jgi:glycosyltransferase involved in cell wall biosynthesis
VAWLSPLPPAASGIADYSAELLEQLSGTYELELVVDPCGPSVRPDLANNHLVLTATELPGRHQAKPYDVFVYQVGNSHFHVYMLDLMRRFRGLVVLHDFYLGGLVLPAIQAGVWPPSLADELEREGETKLAADVRSQRITEDAVLEYAPLNRRILALAGAVIVHSAWTWQRVRQLVRVPVARIPHSAPVSVLQSQIRPAEERQRLGLPLNRFLVATLGFVGPPKRIDSLLRAVARLPARIRQTTDVLVVGQATPAQQSTLLALAEELEMAAAVHFTGRVPFDDFATYARAADVCVQLRYPTRGETSGALLRELGAGAACVISDHGSIAEVPDDIALKVRTPNHEVEDLTATLQFLYDHPDRRQQLGAAAVRYVKEQHNIQHVVQRYAAMIELTAAQRQANDALWFEGACNALAACDDPTAAEGLLDSWAALRLQGQQAIPERIHERSREPCRRRTTPRGPVRPRSA